MLNAALRKAANTKAVSGFKILLHDDFAMYFLHSINICIVHFS